MAGAVGLGIWKLVRRGRREDEIEGESAFQEIEREMSWKDSEVEQEDISIEIHAAPLHRHLLESRG